MFDYLYMLCYIQCSIYYTYITLYIKYIYIVKYVCNEGNSRVVNLIIHKSVTDM